jgi:ATP-binding cassette subfamily C (CFTR/MRP) protein 1
MSNDAEKLQNVMWAIHGVWAAPALIVAILALLWFQVGWATFVGLGVMLLMVPTAGE